MILQIAGTQNHRLKAFSPWCLSKSAIFLLFLELETHMGYPKCWDAPKMRLVCLSLPCRMTGNHPQDSQSSGEPWETNLKNKESYPLVN